MKTIKYLGLTLKPIGNIIGGGFAFKSNFTTWEYSLKPDGYSHKDLYDKARKNHCSVDIYEIDGKLYIPCTGALLGVTNNVLNHIKYCSDYTYWYKWAN